MRRGKAVFQYALNIYLRHRILGLWILFAFVFLGVSFVLADLAVLERHRVLADLGLAGIQLFVLSVVIFFAVQLTGEDQSSGFLYLIFSRPIPPGIYLLAKFAGLLVAAFLVTLLLSLSLFVMLSFQQIAWQSLFTLAILGGFLKTVLAGSLALLFSLLFSSQAVAFLCTLLIYIAAHLSHSFQTFYAHRGSTLVHQIVNIFFFFLPQLDRYNFQDLLSVPHVSWLAQLWLVLGQTLVYAGFYLMLSALIFSQREL